MTQFLMNAHFARRAVRRPGLFGFYLEKTRHSQLYYYNGNILHACHTTKSRAGVMNV